MSEPLTSAQLNEMLLTKSTELDNAIEEYRAALVDWTTKDRDARKARAWEWISTKDTHPKASAALVEAYVEKACDAVLYDLSLADARRSVAKEVLRAKEAQLSAIQSLASTAREEMRLAR